MYEQLKHIDRKEIDLPDTVFVWDIESRVFQSMAVQCLSKIAGIALLEGNFIDTLLGRESVERVKGIGVVQDERAHAIELKIEINVAYGVSIPQKAEEIQTKLTEEISMFTGLHVGCVHVIFKNLIPAEQEVLVPFA